MIAGTLLNLMLTSFFGETFFFLGHLFVGKKNLPSYSVKLMNLASIGMNPNRIEWGGGSISQ